MGGSVARCRGCAPRRARSRSAALRVAVAAAGIALAGCAQQRTVPEGAVALGASRGGQGGLGVKDVGGFVGGGYRYTDEEHTGSALSRREHVLEERAGVGADGYLFAPAFLLYDVAGVVGFTQDWARGSGGLDAYDDGRLHEVDVGARLFSERFHPLNLSYSRIEDVQPRVFQSLLESTTTTATAQQELNFSDGSLRLEYMRRTIEQSQSAAEDSTFVNVTEDRAGAGGEVRLGDSQTLDGSYAYQEVRQRDIEGRDFNQHMANGQHTWMFGQDRRHALRSRVEGTLQEGYLDQRLARWDENLTAKLAERLDGDASLRFEHNDSTLLDMQSLTGNSGVRHRLYESLTSSARVHGGSVTTNDESTDDTAGASVGFDYTKKTGLGVYRCSYSNWVERRWVTNSSGGAIDESYVFPALPPEEVVLVHRGVVPASLTITDAAGLQFYVEGLDYTMLQDSAGQTRITRVVTGAIPPQGAILVDYAYALGSDYTMDTMVQRLRAEHEFVGGLTPYFAFMRQDQDVYGVRGGAGVDPIIERSLIGGLEWRYAPLLLGGEYENRESTVLPYDAVRLRCQYSAVVAEGHQLTLGASQSWFYFEDPASRLAITQGNCRFRWSISRTSSLFVDTAAYYNDDSRTGESVSFSVGGGYEIRWRKFAVRIRGAHRETRGVSTDYRGDEVGIFLVREFGDLPPKVSYASDRFLRQ